MRSYIRLPDSNPVSGLGRRSLLAPEIAADHPLDRLAALTGGDQGARAGELLDGLAAGRPDPSLVPLGLERLDEAEVRDLRARLVARETPAPEKDPIRLWAEAASQVIDALIRKQPLDPEQLLTLAAPLFGGGFFDPTAAGGGEGGPGMVSVRSYTQQRDGRMVQVSDHERGLPGSGPNTPVAGPSSLPPMTNPVPGGKIRGVDGYGSGHFGASRGRRTHNGVDIVVSPGDSVASPVNGTVVRTDVKPYGNDPAYRGIEIESADGHRIRMFYLVPDVSVGTKIKAGEPIGTAQDISRKYPPKTDGRTMTPHIHVEVRNGNGELIDPTGMTGLR